MQKNILDIRPLYVIFYMFPFLIQKLDLHRCLDAEWQSSRAASHRNASAHVLDSLSAASSWSLRRSSPFSMRRCALAGLIIVVTSTVSAGKAVTLLTTPKGER